MRSITIGIMPSKTVKTRIAAIVRIIFPFLICFFCISLFLFLSFMIIEGYSVSRMMDAEHDVSTHTTSGN